jgi:hypothetical protein
VQPDQKRRRLDPRECPVRVLHGVEDRVVVWCAGVVKYGIIGLGTKKDFWEWLTGNGLNHIWTGSIPTDIATNLISMLVEVVLFEHTYPGPRHAVWSTAGVMAMVWYMGPLTIIVPDLMEATQCLPVSRTWCWVG